jgi:hypothetical protein
MTKQRYSQLIDWHKPKQRKPKQRKKEASKAVSISNGKWEGPVRLNDSRVHGVVAKFLIRNGPVRLPEVASAYWTEYGNFTTAIIIYGRGATLPLGVGVAKRNPNEDAPNKETGKTIALWRALEHWLLA